MKKSSFEVIAAFVAILLVVFLFRSIFIRKDDIHDLIENDLSEQFSIVRSYLEDAGDYTRRQALYAFDTIETKLDKLY
ncbi:MAG: hypothetical protein K6F61_04930 [Clostridiales bacterium]|nr:hypothetical protein [Clostridiales bacterium]